MHACHLLAGLVAYYFSVDYNSQPLGQGVGMRSGCSVLDYLYKEYTGHPTKNLQ